MSREIPRDPARPQRSWRLRLANAVLRPALPRRLTADRLVDLARQAEELHDLGAPDVQPPLGRLLHALDTEADLHPVGWIATRVRLVAVLRDRLRAQALFDAHPAILQRPIAAPVVITGLDRSGAALLHQLLATHPRLRSLRSWEALHPAPFRHAPSGSRDPRRRLARRADRGLGWATPVHRAAHPLGIEAPEEDLALLDQSFLSTLAEGALRVPSFARWLEQQDQRPAYETLRRMVQLLDWQEPRERWLLQSAHHLEWLDTLLQVFPDARVVWCHRDPVETLADTCTAVARGRWATSDRVDPFEIGREALAKAGRRVDRALVVRAAHPEAFLDVHHADLLADPVGEIARISSFARLELTAEGARRVEGHRAITTQRPPSALHLGDFGLRERDVAGRFAAYRERSGVVPA